MDFDINKILEVVKNKRKISRLITMVIGTFFLALTYTTFILPNRIVLGGVSGIATIFNALVGWDAGIVVFIFNAILIVVSFIFLGKEKTAHTIFGSILYPVFIALTSPWAKHVAAIFTSETFLTTILLSAVVHAISCGLIYKSGYTTGGSDVVMQLLNKYKNIPAGQASFITSMIFLAAGGFLFGIDKLIYAIIINFISSTIIDKMMIGISDNKLFYIHSKKAQEIQKHTLKKMKAGMTLFKTQGGYSGEKSNTLWCVVPNSQYYALKKQILEIDAEAFFVISDCYEVKGGVKPKRSFFY